MMIDGKSKDSDNEKNKFGIKLTDKNVEMIYG